MRMRPSRPLPNAKERAEGKAYMNDLKRKAVSSVKSYGRNVVGGAKIVGGAIKRGINKLGTRAADDLFGSAEREEKQREAGRALNKFYSGKRGK